jgi:hypothetical protein
MSLASKGDHILFDPSGRIDSNDEYLWHPCLTAKSWYPRLHRVPRILPFSNRRGRVPEDTPSGVICGWSGRHPNNHWTPLESVAVIEAGARRMLKDDFDACPTMRISRAPTSRRTIQKHVLER